MWHLWLAENKKVLIYMTKIIMIHSFVRSVVNTIDRMRQINSQVIMSIESSWKKKNFFRFHTEKNVSEKTKPHIFCIGSMT